MKGGKIASNRLTKQIVFHHWSVCVLGEQRQKSKAVFILVHRVFVRLKVRVCDLV